MPRFMNLINPADKRKTDILIIEESPTRAEQLKYLLETNNYVDE